MASSWAPLCWGPHLGRVFSSWVTAQLALGSSSSIEFSRICCSVLTGARILLAMRSRCWSARTSLTRFEQVKGRAISGGGTHMHVSQPRTITDRQVDFHVEGRQGSGATSQHTARTRRCHSATAASWSEAVSGGRGHASPAAAAVAVRWPVQAPGGLLDFRERFFFEWT